MRSPNYNKKTKENLPTLKENVLLDRQQLFKHLLNEKEQFYYDNFSDTKNNSHKDIISKSLFEVLSSNVKSYHFKSQSIPEITHMEEFSKEWCDIVLLISPALDDIRDPCWISTPWDGPGNGAKQGCVTVDGDYFPVKQGRYCILPGTHRSLKEDCCSRWRELALQCGNQDLVNTIVYPCGTGLDQSIACRMVNQLRSLGMKYVDFQEIADSVIKLWTNICINQNIDMKDYIESEDYDSDCSDMNNDNLENINIEIKLKKTDEFNLEYNSENNVSIQSYNTPETKRDDDYFRHNKPSLSDNINKEIKFNDLNKENIFNDLNKENIFNDLNKENQFNDLNKENKFNDLNKENIFNDLNKENKFNDLNKKNKFNDLNKENIFNDLNKENIFNDLNCNNEKIYYHPIYMNCDNSQKYLEHINDSDIIMINSDKISMVPLVSYDIQSDYNNIPRINNQNSIKNHNSYYNVNLTDEILNYERQDEIDDAYIKEKNNLSSDQYGSINDISATNSDLKTQCFGSIITYRDNLINDYSHTCNIDIKDTSEVDDSICKSIYLGNLNTFTKDISLDIIHKDTFKMEENYSYNKVLDEDYFTKENLGTDYSSLDSSFSCRSRNNSKPILPTEKQYSKMYYESFPNQNFEFKYRPKTNKCFEANSRSHSCSSMNIKLRDNFIRKMSIDFSRKTENNLIFANNSDIVSKNPRNVDHYKFKYNNFKRHSQNNQKSKGNYNNRKRSSNNSTDSVENLYIQAHNIDTITNDNIETYNCNKWSNIESENEVFYDDILYSKGKTLSNEVLEKLSHPTRSLTPHWLKSALEVMIYNEEDEMFEPSPFANINCYSTRTKYILNSNMTLDSDSEAIEVEDNTHELEIVKTYSPKNIYQKNRSSYECIENSDLSTLLSASNISCDESSEKIIVKISNDKVDNNYLSLTEIKDVEKNPVVTWRSKLLNEYYDPTMDYPISACFELLDVDNNNSFSPFLNSLYCAPDKKLRTLLCALCSSRRRQRAESNLSFSCRTSDSYTRVITAIPLGRLPSYTRARTKIPGKQALLIFLIVGTYIHCIQAFFNI